MLVEAGHFQLSRSEFGRCRLRSWPGISFSSVVLPRHWANQGDFIPALNLGGEVFHQCTFLSTRSCFLHLEDDLAGTGGSSTCILVPLHHFRATFAGVHDARFQGTNAGSRWYGGF